MLARITAPNLELQADQATITPSIVLASGAPTPKWTVTETGGAVFPYNTAAFTHNRTTAGVMDVRLNAAVLPYVTEFNMYSDGVIGTLTNDNFLVFFPALESLEMSSNAVLVCDWQIADLALPMTYLNLGSTNSIIYGSLADTPPLMETMYLFGAAGAITGGLADLPASMSHLNIALTPAAITGSLADLPPSMLYLELYNTSSAITGSLGDLPSSILSLYISFTSSTITGGASPMQSAGIQRVYIGSMSMSQADVDDCLLRTWTDRAVFGTGSHSLRIGGRNPAPSGVYQAANPPTTGKEYAYELVNDSNGEGFNLWTVTFTA